MLHVHFRAPTNALTEALLRVRHQFWVPLLLTFCPGSPVSVVVAVAKVPLRLDNLTELREKDEIERETLSLQVYGVLNQTFRKATRS